MNIIGKTDIGKVRRTNQDCFGALDLSNNMYAAVLCDGMGGAKAGNVASDTAVTVISDCIRKNIRRNMRSKSIKSLLESSVVAANAIIFNHANSDEDYYGMGTTVVAAIFSDNVAHIIHAGDSRAYIIKDNEIEQITSDHSIVQHLYELGQITKEEALTHPKRNVITRAVGTQETIRTDYNEIDYEDDDVIVVNKSNGMVVHPAAGNYTGTLVNALLYHCKDSLSGINGVLRPGIVHRIDKNTSGLLIVAKNDISHKGLAEQIKEHSFTRQYETIVYGNIKEDTGIIDQPIGRNPYDRKKMAVTPQNSKNAVTHFKVLERFNEFTHLAVNLETGRTHQIRVHMSYINHPLAGDDMYGGSLEFIERQALHCKSITFLHPVTHKEITVVTDLPDDMKNIIK